MLTIRCFSLVGRKEQQRVGAKATSDASQHGTGPTGRSGTAELGEGGSNRKELDEKLPTNVSDVISRLA